MRQPNAFPGAGSHPSTSNFTARFSAPEDLVCGPVAMRQMTNPSYQPEDRTKDANQGTVVVFRIQLLPPSETFIVAQAVAMRRFSPFFVGWRKTAGIDLPENTSWTVDDGGLRGRLRELRFRYAGPTREQVARLRARAPRLVYAHFAPDGYAAMQLAEQLGVPLVTALHGYDVTISDKAMGATRLGREYLQGRSTLQKMGALFLSCSDLCSQLEGWRWDTRRIAPSFTRLEWMWSGLSRQPRLRPREKSVLFVGRLVEKKGCGSLIEAMVERAAALSGSRVGGDW